MAIVKAEYKRDRTWAKASLKSMHQAISQENGKRRIPTLFCMGGCLSRQEAYGMIDESSKGSYFYRFLLSPDPKTEDTKRDLFLRDFAERTMMSLEDHLFPGISAPKTEKTKRDVNPRELTQIDILSLEEQMQRYVPWVAVIHDDGAAKRFVRVVAVVGRKLRVPDLQAIRRGATEAALAQRREHDLIYAHRE